MDKQASATAATMAKKESIWRDRFARHVASKQSVEAFCRSESVSSALFYQWRKRLDINAVNPALAMRTPSAASTFIDLGPANDSAVGTTPMRWRRIGRCHVPSILKRFPVVIPTLFTGRYGFDR